VRRAATQRPLADDDPRVIAIAADHPIEAAPLPVFGLDDADAIAAFIAGTVGLSD
jgi:molybdopterin-guanine dinucleotide biosynthesis adapter protein